MVFTKQKAREYTRKREFKVDVNPGEFPAS
jgi:hypothetical protein